MYCKQFSIIHYIQYGPMIMNEEFRRLWKEAAVAYFKKLS